MKIILTQDIEKLGNLGGVIVVKDGYARNYLIPKGLAKVYNKKSLAEAENLKQKKQKTKEKELEKAKEFAERVSKVSCTVTVQVGPNDKLYGSVTPADIQKALEAEGFEIDKKAISIDESIEKLGVYHASVKVHPDITAKCKVWVVKR